MAMGRGGSNKINRNKRTERQKQRVNEQPQKTMKNRIRKLKKHIKVHKSDMVAIAAIEK